jgi:hypothetical protein
MHADRFRFRIVPVVAALALGSVSSSALADIVFVNAAQVLPSGLQNGLSWATAFKDLQTGLGAASSGDDVWVAKGTYFPTATTDRTISFLIPSGVRVLGGFESGDASVIDRRPLEHVTTLSGNIGGPGLSDNSFHVVRIDSVANPTVVSGFHIVGGNANGGGSNNLGGGVRIAGNSAAMVSECVFIGNDAVAGTAIHVVGAVATSPVLANCIVRDNEPGIAVDIQGGRANLAFCTIVRNQGVGVRVLNGNGASSITSSIVRDNGDGPVLSEQVSVTNATVNFTSDNVQGGAGLGLGCVDLDPAFGDVDGADGIPGNADDRFTLRGDSPSIDDGSTQNFPSDLADLDGDLVTAEPLPRDIALAPRRVDDPVSNATGIGPGPHTDMGAFEYQRPRTIFVNHAATGANNGTSWQNAYVDLQDAIAELADIKFGGPGEIWVAKGTYKPTDGADPTISFKPSRGTKIFGGFVGGEASRALRDPRQNETILSGELGAPGPSGNTTHVLRFSGTFVDGSTLVDGFTIRDGVSVNGPGQGGGVRFDTGTTAVVANCVVTACAGNGSGAVAFLTGGTTAPTLFNSIVAGNTPSAPGLPGIVVLSGSPAIVNCTIAGNVGPAATATSILVAGGSPTFANCASFANIAGGATSFAAQIAASSGTGTVSRSAFQGFNAALEPELAFSGSFAVGLDGDVADANGSDNVFGTADDDYEPTACSSLVDAGSTALVPVDLGDGDDDGDASEAWPFDATLNTRIEDLAAPNAVLGPTGAIDIGAIERPIQLLADPDFDNDGDVDGADLAVLLGAWNALGSQFDLNGDCFIDAADLAILLGAWS